MNNIKNWKLFTDEEKNNNIPKIGELRGAGFSWEEIGEIYSTNSETIRSYYNDHKTPKTGELAEAIVNGTYNNSSISMEVFLSMMERLESLELEVANIKKLHVESAAIERLEESEYKYFVQNKKTLEEYKFKTEGEVRDFINSERGFLYPKGFIERNVRDLGQLIDRSFIIKGDFKADVDVSNSKITDAINNITKMSQDISMLKEDNNI